MVKRVTGHLLWWSHFLPQQTYLGKIDVLHDVVTFLTPVFKDSAPSKVPIALHAQRTQALLQKTIQDFAQHCAHKATKH